MNSRLHALQRHYAMRFAKTEGGNMGVSRNLCVCFVFVLFAEREGRRSVQKDDTIFSVYIESPIQENYHIYVPC